MSRVVLATCARLPDGDDDAEELVAALWSCGVQARWAVWDDPSATWADDLVVVRSTWDYTPRRAEFLAWARAVPRLLNPFPLIEWSTDKRYVADLHDAGLPVVPTTVADPRPDVPDAAEFVVKPSVGAGSRDVGRFRNDDAGRRAAGAHVDALRAGGATALVQPYLADVDTLGETALVHVDGVFSHAVRKAAMLPADTAHPAGDELYVEESITDREPSGAELAVGAAVLSYVQDRFGVVPLYARVDLLPSPDGPVVVELELVEPSLFLRSADRAKAFAAAVAARA